MKKQFFIFLLAISFSASAQFVARMEVKEDIPGICDKKEVYALFPSFTGQKEAVCVLSKDDILKKLNEEVKFIKDNPKHKDKGMVGIIVNCGGEVVQCEIDNKSTDPELDKQILAVFKTLTFTSAGKLNGHLVDSSLLYSYKIKKGKITWS